MCVYIYAGIDVASSPIVRRAHLRAAPLGLYKIFICVFEDCALVNTILDMQHLFYRNPSPDVFCNQYCAIYDFPPASLFRHSTYNTGNGDIV